MVRAALVLASFLALVNATPLGRKLAPHESVSLPAGFKFVKDADPSTVLNLRFALKNTDMDGLRAAVLEGSTPSSSTYGVHLSVDEMVKFVQPTSDTTAAFQAWLDANGLSATPISVAQDWLSVPMAVVTVGNLFSTVFSEFQHIESGATAIRTLSYTLPEELQGVVDLVYPTVTFDFIPSTSPVFHPLASPSSAAAAPASCGENFTPTCAQDLYNIPLTPATQGNKNILAVSGFSNEFANKADLQLYLENFRTDIPSTTSFNLDTVDGGKNSQNINQAGLEANLDIQQTVGLATGVDVTFVSVGSRNTDGLGGFVDIITFLMQQNPIPTVLTTSYGSDETTADTTVAMSDKLCDAHTALTSLGVSILFASGDGGVAGSHGETCLNGNVDFLPTFPSGCPFITAVGATQGSVQVSAPFSSGGFSNRFGRPSYQDEAVTTYLGILGNTDAGLFNTSGRGYPDVSANGVNCSATLSGQIGTVGGTSCSSPMFSTLVALINDKLISEGASPLGFLNPFFYANPSAFTDITVGDNPGCNTNGFPATTGWDPVTGLGTPNFPALLSAALAAAAKS